MSIVPTYNRSCASIAEVILIASSDTVIDAASSLIMYDYFFLPLSHVLPLVLIYLFLLITSGMLEPLTCPSWSVY